MWHVYKKELLELLRDRKTLFFVVALPLIIFPVLFGLLSVVMANVQINEAQKIHRYLIIGETNAADFAQDLFYHKSFKKVEHSATSMEEIKLAIQNDEVDLAIIIPDTFAQHMDLHQQSEWQIVFNDAVVVNQIFQRIEKLVNKHVKVIQQHKLEALGIEASQQAGILNPVVLSKVDTADTRENLGEKLGGLIPYILIPLCLAGAIYPAIDLGAGEKERGTLETLLLTPLSRTSIVLGKFFTILTTAIISAVLTVGSMGFWALLMGSILDIKPVHDAVGIIGLFDLSLVLLMLLPLAAIFASLLLMISIYARSFKEAQNYMAPINIVIFVPLVGALVPGVTLTWGTALIPIMNIALGIKEIIKGTVDYSMVWVIFAVMSGLAVLMLALSVRWFNKEEVLFR